MKSVCPFCEKAFLNKHFEEHLRSHTNERPFVCDTCQETFTTNGNLTQHIDSRHRNKKFKCDDCLSLFTSQQLLSKHKRKARESRGVKCPKCCIKISKRGNFNHHLRLAHGISGTELEAFKNFFVQQESQGLEQVSRDVNQASSPTQTTMAENRGKQALEDADDPDFIPATQVPVEVNNPQDGQLQGGLKRTFNNASRSKQDFDFVAPKPRPAKQAKVQTTTHQPQYNEDEMFEYSQQIVIHDDNEPNEPESVALDLQQPLADGKLDLTFVLHTWGLTANAELIKTVTHPPAANEKELLYTITEFLRKGKLEIESDKLIEILHQGPEKYVGYFISSLMILSVTFNQPLTDLIKLYQNCNDLPEEFKNLAEKLSLHSIQKCLASNDYEQICSITIPEDLRMQIKFGTGLNSQELQVQFEQMKSKVIVYVSKLFYNDLETLKYSLADNHLPLLHKAQMYTALLQDFMSSGYLTCKPNLFKIILDYQLENQIGTKVFLKVKTGQSITPLYLHPPVFSMFGSTTPSEVATVSASHSQVKLLTDLFYLEHEPSYFKGRINMETFELAQKLEIGDLFHFIFRGKDYKQFVECKNKVDIFQILLNLERLEETNEIAGNLMEWFADNQRSDCLNGLSEDQVVEFCSRDELKVPEIEVYKMMVKWAFYDCGEKCEDAQTAAFKPNVNESFRKVRKALRICNLNEHFDELQQQNYITLQDVIITFKAKNHLAGQQLDSGFCMDMRARTS